MKMQLYNLCAVLMGVIFSTHAWSDIPAGPEASTKGMFGEVVNWPVIPIHTALLPNGNVLSFGSTVAGKQGGLVSAVWDPTLGIDASAHTVTPNTLHTDTFCAGQTVLPTTGETLVAGGDATVNDIRNYSTADASLFDSTTNLLNSHTPMAFKRWYPSLVALSNGDIAVLGGRDEKDTPTFASTPEIFNPINGFRKLTGAKNEFAYGKFSFSWAYPRGFLAPNGKVFIIGHSGRTFWLDTDGEGSVVQTDTIVPVGNWQLPSVMYAPGRILSIRLEKEVVQIDLNSPTITVRQIAGINSLRRWSNGTVLADGKVFVNGGSDVPNSLGGFVAYDSEIWDPATEQWTVTASAAIPRLYHSIALLLPDATVLTGGGGAPGPLKNLNAEIFYPPYLYKKDGSGTPAIRPSIDNAPDSIVWNHPFTINYTSQTPISRLTLVRAGSTTHSYNSDQRFMELNFTQKEGNTNTLIVNGPIDINYAPPGFYMLFAFDQDGVPSIAKMIHLVP